MRAPLVSPGKIDSAERHDVRQSHAVRETAALLGLGGALVAAFVLSLALGSTRVPFADVVGALTRSGGIDSGNAAVIESIRVPRSLTAVLAGAALGIAGL